MHRVDARRALRDEAADVPRRAERVEVHGSLARTRVRILRVCFAPDPESERPERRAEGARLAEDHLLGVARLRRSRRREDGEYGCQNGERDTESLRRRTLVGHSFSFRRSRACTPRSDARGRTGVASSTKEGRDRIAPLGPEAPRLDSNQQLFGQQPALVMPTSAPNRIG